MCLGVALGPAGAFAAMLHLVNHSLAKSVLFLLSGRIYRRYGTADVAGVSGLRRAMPVTAGLFAGGILAVVGLPPFGMFISELALLRAGFLSGHYALMALVLGLLLLVFVSLIWHLNRMLHGEPQPGTSSARTTAGPGPALACLAAVVVLGICRARRAGATVDDERGDRGEMSGLLSSHWQPDRGIRKPRRPDAECRRRISCTCSFRPSMCRRLRHCFATSSAVTRGSCWARTDRRRPTASACTTCSPTRPRTGSSTRPPCSTTTRPSSSLATFHYPASRFEREIFDLFGIRPPGTPIPGPSCDTGSGRRTSSRSGRTRRRRRSKTMAAGFRSGRSAAKASSRSRSDPSMRA